MPCSGKHIALRISRFYKLMWWVRKIIFLQTMRVFSVNTTVLNRQGGYVLAVTHISHMEVVCASLMTRRQVRWITRKEFYCNRVLTWLFDAMGCLKINRTGIPASTVRAAINAARCGDIIGIFPEGGVVAGAQLVIRGGPVKRGMCSIAIHGGVPIIPCVVLGTEKLKRIRPWLPGRSGKLWIAFGEPIYPTPGTISTRATRMELADRVGVSFRQLYQKLLLQYGISDSDVP